MFGVMGGSHLVYLIVPPVHEEPNQIVIFIRITSLNWAREMRQTQNLLKRHPLDNRSCCIVK